MTYANGKCKEIDYRILTLSAVDAEDKDEEAH